MADKRTGNFAAADSAAEQNDPFAELTRIMGFDPRQEQAPRGDFAADLEDELTHELDEAERAATAHAHAARSADPADEDVPVIHLRSSETDTRPYATAGYAPLEDADDFLEDADDAQHLEDEFNALLGNVPAYAEDDAPDQHVAAHWDEQLADEQAETDFVEPELDVGDISASHAHVDNVTVEPVVEQPEVQDDPFAMLAAMAEKYKLSSEEPMRAPEPARSYEPAVSTPVAAAASGYAAASAAPASRMTAAPEIDTIEVSDRAAIIADDLDLPDLPVVDEPQSAAAYDDIDVEFNNLLNQMSSHEPLQPARAAYQPAAPAKPAPIPAAAPVAAAARVAPAAPMASRYDEEIQLDLSDEDLAGVFDDPNDGRHAYVAEDDGFDLDDGFDEEVPVAAYENAEAVRPRRGLLVAAIVGGIALLGAAGAIAMSMMGSAEGGLPALVKSDHSPIKVRPANPGGTAVPNQDSSVYETVANRQSGSAPQQDKLLNAAEEPIELADELPDNSDEDVADIDQPKSEDRIDQLAAEALPETESGTIAVAPRKVRTVLVKPDGTLAPAEEPAKPEAAADKTVTQTVAQKPQARKPVAAAPAAADETPAAVAQDQTTASIEAQPAPAGAWAMQIASETSEQAAQAAYKKLVARYPRLLDGKDVSIVKADVAGKGTRWRVRVLSGSRNEAAGLCSNLKSAGGSCFVSKT